MVCILLSNQVPDTSEFTKSLACGFRFFPYLQIMAGKLDRMLRPQKIHRFRVCVIVAPLHLNALAHGLHTLLEFSLRSKSVIYRTLLSKDVKKCQNAFAMIRCLHMYMCIQVYIYIYMFPLLKSEKCSKKN